MLIETFMILLTTASSGEIGGAFAVQQSAEGCAEKLPAIVFTIEQSGTTVTEAGCEQGDWPFEPFAHAAAEDAPRFDYLVDYSGGESPAISPMTNAAACEAGRSTAAASAGDASRIYCVTSTQRWAD